MFLLQTLVLKGNTALLTILALSNNCTFLPIIIPELFRRTIFLFLKDTVEVREVIEAAVITNLRDGSLRVHQHAGGVTDTDIGDIVGEGLPGPQLEETAESGRGHTYEFSQ